MPFIGSFNRRIALEIKVTTQDATGHPVESWLPARTMWANRRDVTASERFRSSQELATRTSVFTVRWFRELTAGDWRIQHEDLVWDIEGIAEPRNTRRQYWEMTASASETAALVVTDDTSPPTMPENLTAAVFSPTQVDLTWSASTDNVGVTGYNIYRDGLIIGTSAVNLYSDTSVSDAGTYEYHVSAFDAAGNESPLSVSDSATTVFAINSVHFDGTSDYLLRGAGLTGAVDSKRLVGSVWIRRTAGFGTIQRILYSTGTSLSVGFAANNTVSIVAENSAGSIILLANSLVAITDTNVHHIAWAFDLANSARRLIYVDDAPSISVTHTNANIDFTVANYAIGARDTGQEKYAGDMADLQVWFGKDLDISDTLTRRMFITADGKPVDPAVPAATALGVPIIRLSGGTDTWQTNDGSGGGFGEVGMLTDGQLPVEL
jgi:SPP1 family predicted phage head-tail adaptor